MNAGTELQQQNVISEYGQGLAYWTHKYYTGHIIASYYFQCLIGPANLLSAISCYKFHVKQLTKECVRHNYMSFGHLFIYM